MPVTTMGDEIYLASLSAASDDVHKAIRGLSGEMFNMTQHEMFYAGYINPDPAVCQALRELVNTLADVIGEADRQNVAFRKALKQANGV